jgi:DNA-binding CsgD family transcriptional regulator
MARQRNIGPQIIELRKNGDAYNTIAKKMDCSKSTVQYHCTKVGLTDIGLRLIEVSEDIQKEIPEYRKTHTLNETAEKFGISVSTVKNYQNKKAL